MIELAEFDATSAAGCHMWQRQARALYASLSMPTSVQNAGVRDRVAHRVGVYVDGTTGSASLPAAAVDTQAGADCAWTSCAWHGAWERESLTCSQLAFSRFYCGDLKRWPCHFQSMSSA
eukprot:3508732-Amphidinium_carterae.1